jgi:hypothetical protein
MNPDLTPGPADGQDPITQLFADVSKLAGEAVQQISDAEVNARLEQLLRKTGRTIPPRPEPDPEKILSSARRQAAKIVDLAKSWAGRKTEEATLAAQATVEAAREQAERIKADADEYSDMALSRAAEIIASARSQADLIIAAAREQTEQTEQTDDARVLMIRQNLPVGLSTLAGAPVPDPDAFLPVPRPIPAVAGPGDTFVVSPGWGRPKDTLGQGRRRWEALRLLADLGTGSAPGRLLTTAPTGDVGVGAQNCIICAADTDSALEVKAALIKRLATEGEYPVARVLLISFWADEQAGEVPAETWPVIHVLKAACRFFEPDDTPDLGGPVGEQNCRSRLPDRARPRPRGSLLWQVATEALSAGHGEALLSILDAYILQAREQRQQAMAALEEVRRERLALQVIKEETASARDQARADLAALRAERERAERVASMNRSLTGRRQQPDIQMGATGTQQYWVVKGTKDWGGDRPVAARPRRAAPMRDTAGMDLRPDPLAARDAAGLMVALRAFRRWAGQPSYREMAARCQKRAGVSTMCTALVKDELPPLWLIDAIVEGCGGSDADREEFASAWRCLDAERATAAGEGPPDPDAWCALDKQRDDGQVTRFPRQMGIKRPA